MDRSLGGPTPSRHWRASTLQIEAHATHLRVRVQSGRGRKRVLLLSLHVLRDARRLGRISSTFVQPIDEGPALSLPEVTELVQHLLDRETAAQLAGRRAEPTETTGTTTTLTGAPVVRPGQLVVPPWSEEDLSDQMVTDHWTRPVQPEDRTEPYGLEPPGSIESPPYDSPAPPRPREPVAPRSRVARWVERLDHPVAVGIAGLGLQMLLLTIVALVAARC